MNCFAHSQAPCYHHLNPKSEPKKRMQPTIRPAAATDIEIIVDFSRRLNEEDPSFTGEVHFDEAAVRAALAQFLADSALGRAWLVADGETPIGYVVLTFGFSLESHGRDGIIDEIYVAAEYRGQGVGARLLEFVEAEARRIGLKKIYLEVEQPNTRAKKFYSRLGFVDHNRSLMSKLLVEGR